jgi:hypothetical protein
MERHADKTVSASTNKKLKTKRWPEAKNAATTFFSLQIQNNKVRGQSGHLAENPIGLGISSLRGKSRIGGLTRSGRGLGLDHLKARIGGKEPST